MNFHHPPVSEMEDGARMMFRSRHIYILLGALIHLGIGAYITQRAQPWRRAVQLIGSALVILASLLMVGAFFYEPEIAGLTRPLTLPAILGMVFGVLCHAVSGLRQREEVATL